jgi:type II secretory pathway component PulJ
MAGIVMIRGGKGALCSTPRNDCGFSLLEAVLALALLTGGCLAVVGMFVVGDRAQARAAHVDEALALVRSVMEWKRALPYERLDEDDLDGDGLTDGRSLHGADARGSFHREWQILRDRPRPGLTTISVEVTWSDERGRTHRLTSAMVRADTRAGDG